MRKLLPIIIILLFTSPAWALDVSADRDALIAYIAQLSSKIIVLQHISDNTAGWADRYASHIESLSAYNYPSGIGGSYRLGTSTQNGYFHSEWDKGGLVLVDLMAIRNPWDADCDNLWGTFSDCGVSKTDIPGANNLSDLYTCDGGQGCNSTGQSAYTKWYAFLDWVAAGLQELEDEGVVVIFRPLHEVNGGWFWWGYDSSNATAATYKLLWQDMHDYLVTTKGLTNLVWFFSPSGIAISESRPAADGFYPGDSYVDIVGLDNYPTDGLLSNSSIDDHYAALVAHGKPFGMGEWSPNAASAPADADAMLTDLQGGSFTSIVIHMWWQTYGNEQALYSQANVANYFADSWTLSRSELVPNAPTLTDYAGTSINPTLETDNTYFGPRAHDSTKWQVCSSPDCSAIVWYSGWDSTNKHTVTIPANTLTYNTTYYWRSAFAIDVNGTETAGAWSTVRSFTTGGVSDTPVNNSPVLNPIGAKSVDEGQLLQFTVKATDPDGDTLTYSASNLPAWATFDLSTQIFSWIPSYVIASNYTVTFKVSDDGTPPLNDSETVTITVREANITLPSAPTHLRISYR